MSAEERLLRAIFSSPDAYCGESGWNNGNEYVCDLPAGHDGKHADQLEGWEW